MIKALDMGMEELSTDVSAETSVVSEKKPTRSMKRADALAVVVESFIAHGAEAMNSGDKHQIVVHVSAETLSRFIRAEPTAHSVRPAQVEGLFQQCELEEGPAIAFETAHRLACDCSVVRIIEDEKGNPLDVGRKTRSIPPALKRALNSRDKGCRFPGCCNTKWTDGHHIKHWANGGETKLGNLVTLCRFHHRLVHEGGVQIQTLDDGALRFIKPDGESFDNAPSPPLNSDASPVPPPASRLPAQWLGHKMDYGLGVEVLLRKEARMRKGLAGIDGGNLTTCG